MNKKYLTIFLFLVLVILIFSFVWYSKPVQSNMGFEHLIGELRNQNYSIEVKDVDKDFLSGTRKRVVFPDGVLDVYLYRNSSAMDKDAKRIDSGGCSYSNGWKSVKVSWVSIPHFYKKEDIIVQYVGENENTINCLKGILGEQFAGGK